MPETELNHNHIHNSINQNNFAQLPQNHYQDHYLENDNVDPTKAIPRQKNIQNPTAEKRKIEEKPRSTRGSPQNGTNEKRQKIFVAGSFFIFFLFHFFFFFSFSFLTLLIFLFLILFFKNQNKRLTYFFLYSQ